MKATIVSKTLAPNEDTNSHTPVWPTVSESVPSELEKTFAFAGCQRAGHEFFTDLPNPNILPKPSRNRRPERIARLIAAGEQPTGKMFNPLIPEGIGRDSYARALYTVKHPMELPPPIPKRLGEALGIIVEKGTLVKEWRAIQMRKIRSWAEELQPQRVVWRNSLHSQVKSVIGHLHLPLYDKLLRNIEYEGKDYIDSLMQGRRMLGTIRPSGVFPECRSPATLSVKEWVANPCKRNLAMIASVRSSGDAALDKLSWEKTLQEVDKKYAIFVGLETLDLDRVCLTPRWPKWERKEDGSWSCRNLSDWKRSKGNETVEMPEKYTPEDLTLAHSIVRVLHGVFGPVACQLYVCDWSMAFRQTPKHPAEKEWTYELAWNPVGNKVVVLSSCGQTFGGK